LRNLDWLLLGIVLLGMVIYQVRQRSRRGTSVQGKKPGHTDNKAKQIMEEEGFSLLQVQPVINVTMEIQGRPHRFEMKSDYLVSKGGRNYLVRVKRETKPVRLHSKVWRNALLRDVLLFKTYGILVLDLGKETISEVHFQI